MDESYSNKPESVLNFRDLGGKKVNDKPVVRKGIIFRSASPDNIKMKDVRRLKSLNIKTVIDLRAPYEGKANKKYGLHFKRINLPLDFEKETREKLKPLFKKKNSESEIEAVSNALYIKILDASRSIISDVFNTLLADDDTPVLIHCQAGKDRTGIICAIINLAMGVERRFIIEDFMRSNDELLPFFKRMLFIRRLLYLGFFPTEKVLFAITLRQKNIESVIDRIENHYGGIEKFLEDSGFDSSSLDLLKKKLLLSY